MENILVGVMALVVCGIVGLVMWKDSQGKTVSKDIEEEDDLTESQGKAKKARRKAQEQSCLKVI